MYMEFSILHNKIEDVVKKSTEIWRLIYGLTMVKEGEADPFEGRKNEEAGKDKEEETKKKKKDTTIEDTQQKNDEMVTNDEH